MILVDSSAFVEFYRPSGNPKVREAVAGAMRDDLVAVNGIIQVEIVAFARNQEDQQSLTSDFEAFHWIDLKWEHFKMACEMGWRLRASGITVPATDLIIAACAIKAEALLYHLDSDFDHIAQHSDLRAKNLRAE